MQGEFPAEESQRRDNGTLIAQALLSKCRSASCLGGGETLGRALIIVSATPWGAERPTLLPHWEPDPRAWPE
jgi:hypothetical protein